MGAHEDLASALSSNPGHHRREVTDDLRMKGQLGLLEKERVISVEQDPKQAEKPEGAVGKLFFRLPTRFWPPVFVQPSEVGHALRVPMQLQLLQLRDRDFQRVGDPPKPGV